MTRARDVANIDGILTTKGDIYAATAASTPARLGVGSNGETIVADSSTATGLRYTAGTVQANPVINSAFQVWQRGTTYTYGGSVAYTADRWNTDRVGGGASSYTISRQVTNDTTNLPNIQYAARVQRVAGNTATGNIFFNQPIETINSIPFVGKVVTLSYYARAGANYSATSGLLNASIVTGTGTDQNYLAVWTGTATAGAANATLTTTWQRFSVTGTIATSATEISIPFIFSPTGTAGANDWFEITGVQLDIGSVALPFRTNAGTIQGELAACQRYYYRITQATFNRPFGMGQAYLTTAAFAHINFPVTMRIAPTALEQNGTAGDYRWSTAAFGAQNLNAVPAFNTATENASIVTGTVAANLVAGNATNLQSTNAGAYLGWSAEL
jgi:hypothetical protein